jgi:peptidoglycan/xylan/chitin deacetylase (PgdA/CDA1 family)
MTLDILGLSCNLALRMCSVIEARLSIVLFHSVLDSPDPLRRLVPSIADFAEQLRWLRHSFNILPLREATERLYAGRLPARALCITFDDGYRDNALHALPVLSEHKVPATFFVTTRYLEGGLMWNDRVIEAVRAWRGDKIELSAYGLDTIEVGADRGPAVRELLKRIKYLPYDQREAVTAELLTRSGARIERMMMNEDEIRRLHRAGMEIGGHTVNHPILCALDDARVLREITDNKAHLEAITGESVDSFAYPNGRPQQDFAARHVAMLRGCGYRRALTTAPGTATAAASPWQLPRYTPWDRSRAKYLGRLLGNYFENGEQLAESSADAPA